MTYERILLEVRDKVAHVTLNRPEMRNAMDEKLLDELSDCFGRLARRRPAPSANKRCGDDARGERPRVAVLSGAGKVFCAGADVHWMRRAADYSTAKNRKDAYRLVRALRAIDECPLPVVGRIHGGVYGGGLGLVAACDIVAAEESTRMVFSECRMGILPAVITSYVLPKIGMGHTRRLYLSGEAFGMEEARRMGLVHAVVPEHGLDARVKALTAGILQGGPNAQAVAKAYLRKMGSLSDGARAKFSVGTLLKARSSPEGKEGFTAFLEKRKPSWTS